MNQTANCKVINTHWVYSHRYALLGTVKEHSLHFISYKLIRKIDLLCFESDNHLSPILNMLKD
jgi:hypothetical protein